MKLIPNRWSDFQHYKDRNPPWIRLHKKLLDNKDFHRLPVESRALAPMLWLLASESVDGVIDASLDDLAFRLRQDERNIKLALDPLVQRGFFSVEHDASAPLAERQQVAVPETEAETENITEAETEASCAGPSVPARRKPPAPKPTTPTAAVWDAYSTAYARRYAVDPLRNAKVNGQLAQFVSRVPHDEAPVIATFYVSSDDAFYVKQMHAVDYLLRDAEKLRTQSITGMPPMNGNHQAAQGERLRRLLKGQSGEVIDA